MGEKKINVLTFVRKIHFLKEEEEKGPLNLVLCNILQLSNTCILEYLSGSFLRLKVLEVIFAKAPE